MFWKPLEIERLDMRHGLSLGKSRYVRHGGVSSHIHEYALTGKCPLAAVT
jgi:hypothetical protein